MKRTYKSLLNVFDKLNKDKLSTKEFRENCTMKRNSVYQTLSRALKDNVLTRDEFGFYFVVDKENRED